METKYYLVTKIEGEYAYLQELSGECREEVFIALALLPEETDLGTKLRCELFQYSIWEE